MRRLKNNGLVVSMGRVGSSGDNAAMESFFSLLQKNDLDTRRVRNSRPGMSGDSGAVQNQAPSTRWHRMPVSCGSSDGAAEVVVRVAGVADAVGGVVRVGLADGRSAGLAGPIGTVNRGV